MAVTVKQRGKLVQTAHAKKLIARINRGDAEQRALLERMPLVVVWWDFVAFTDWDGTVVQRTLYA